MRHRRRVKHFSRKSGPRRALLRGLVTSLVENGRIKTTLAKAKEVRRHVEKSITLGKDGDLAARRLLISRLANTEAAMKIVDSVSPRFQDRQGGYTRIIKIGRRPGDQAEMAFIEFVDYQFEKLKKKSKSSTKDTEGKVTEEDKAQSKEQNRNKKKTASVMAAKKKNLRKRQSKSRHSVRV